jgi:transposase-like protein
MKSVNSGKLRKPRRKFTPEFKAEAVKLCSETGQSIGKVAKNLDLTETALRAWVKQAKIDAGKWPVDALTTAEKQELAALRKENRQLKMEREILKKATAFFAKEQM